jgi:hypothetical protein
MFVKADKLAQTIADLQSVISAQEQADTRFYSIARSLETTSAILKTGKLSLHIISHHTQAAQTLQRLLRTSLTLTEKYLITVAPVPQEGVSSVAPEPRNSLLMPISTDQQHEFHLTATQPLVIGRHPNCQVFIPDPYLLVSGHHADLRPTPDATPQGRWQIRDRSRNGTFVNGHCVEDWQVLEDGDRITLGNPFPTDTCPTLTFETLYSEATSHSVFHPVLNCDVVCFVFDAERSLSRHEKYLLEQASQAPLVKWMAIATNGNAPTSNDQNTETAIGISELRTLLEPSSKDFAVEEWILPLEDEFSRSDLKNLDQNNPDSSNSNAANRYLEKQVEKLVRSLELLVRRKPEDTLAKRLALDVTAQSDVVNALLNLQEKRSRIEKTWDELKLSSSCSSSSNTVLEIHLKSIDGDFSTLFKQIRERLLQSKTRLLDDFLENSILNQIQQFVQRLQPCIVQQGGKKFLELKPAIVPAASLSDKRAKSRRKRFRLAAFQSAPIPTAATISDCDVNTALLHFCRRELIQWADQEWERFLFGDRTKGFIELLENLKAILASQENGLEINILPPTLPDYTPLFDEGFTRPSTSTRYQEAHPFFHILKKVRNQWMQFLFLFSFLSVLGIAGRKQIMQHLTAPIAVAFHTSPWIASLIAGGILILVLKLVVQWYRDDRDSEREDEAKKLRQGLINHYQALVKNRLADKVMHRFMLALDTEEQNVKDLLQPLQRLPEQATSPTNQSSLSLQQRIERHTALNRDHNDVREKLEKLKRSRFH